MKTIAAASQQTKRLEYNTSANVLLFRVRKVEGDPSGRKRTILRLHVMGSCVNLLRR